MVTDKERLATLETKTTQVQEDVQDHESRIDVLEKALVSLVHEVKLIRYALFALAGGSAVPIATPAFKAIIAALAGQ